MNHKIAFVAARNADAREAVQRLRQRYDEVSPAKADVVVALGGDGFMLQTLHRFMGRDVPIYGMNRGTVGFLMNAWRENGLHSRLERAQRVVLNPLLMEARTVRGDIVQAHAINEVSLLRQTRQTAKIAISIDGQKRLDELACDGVMVATPAGSTAYNLSVHGPILPLGAGLLALTPISPFRPRRWRGAVLPRTARVTLDILEPGKRPVSAVADSTEVRNVTSVTVTEDTTRALTLLFDPEHHLEERILKEQFLS
ncbi:MAG: NAD kinase [Alphaproteobacteria bacterium]|nr:NAD kinase [Alphaproteobacteria bacterium]MCW5739000.1 NAD kinase [Alphaproteobacteria bacterium]